MNKMKPNSSVREKLRSQKGFTFIEIMFVVVIIGILTTIAGKAYIGKTTEARITKAQAQIEIFRSAITTYEMNTGEIPDTSKGLIVLIQKPGDMDKETWKGPYVDDVPNDPWNIPYFYKSPGEHGWQFEIYSSGPDRQDGTGDDIKSWKRDIAE